MIKCINTNSLEGAESYDELLEQAVKHRFAGLELSVDADRRLPPRIKGETWPTAIEKAQKKGLEICSVTTREYDIVGLGSSAAKVRDIAIEYLNNFIVCAAEEGRGAIVVIAAHENRPLGALLDGSYEQTFNLVFESLKTLAARAEEHFVYLAIENPGSGLLLSPLELRELIDEINNPYMGICLNPHYAERLGDPLDWLNILDRRIIAVRLPVEQPALDEADKKYQSLLNTLNTRAFPGALVYIYRE